MESTIPVALVGSASTGSWRKSVSDDSRKLLVPSRPNTPKSTIERALKMASAMGAFQLFTTAVRGLGDARGEDGLATLPETTAVTSSPPPSRAGDEAGATRGVAEGAAAGRSPAPAAAPR